jgi:hypothetical protein
MPNLKLTSDWIESDESFRPEFDRSLCNLGINVDGTWLTEYETENGNHAERIEVPAYPLAEWIVENWWSLLYEPEKGERSRHDPQFRARHWLGTAREGFVLPDAWMHSLGKGLVRINAEPSYFPHSRLVLRNAGEGRFLVEDISREMSSFVESVVDRLTSKGVTDTNLQAIWAAFKSLDGDERRYCQLLGALGISPYEAAPEMGDLLTNILGGASEQVTEDFCDAAAEGDLLDAAADMLKSLNALENEPELDLSNLFRLYTRGEKAPKRTAIAAVRAARDQFRISSTDPQGGEAFLNALSLSSIVYEKEGIRDIEEPVLHGAVRRSENVSQINLIRKQPVSRRFDAVRACYLAWTKNSDGDRLVTRARVSDQQASRIFAAEMLAPIDFIRAKTRNNLLSQYGAATIAEELNVSSAVVVWQAAHNRIELVDRHGGRWN